jgi:hypothetical protein
MDAAPTQAAPLRVAEAADTGTSTDLGADAASIAHARTVERDGAVVKSAAQALVPKRGGSPGFAAQLKTSAGDFRARTQRAPAAAVAGTSERAAPLPATLPVAPAINTAA